MALVPINNKYPDQAGYTVLDTERNILRIMSDGILQDMTNSTPEGWVNVKDFGAKGDGVTDDTETIQEAYTYASNNNYTVYFPAGTFIVSNSITGKFTRIIGAGANETIIKGIGDNYYIFDLENGTPSKLYQSVSNIQLKSDDRYGEIYHISGIRISPSYNIIIENVNINNLEYGIYLTDSWGSKISSIRATYISQPLYIYISNGSLIEHFYAQRFKTIGIYLQKSLTTTLNTIILEYGINDATGIRLQATSNIIVNGLYTEGDMGKDVFLYHQNQRVCKNTILNGLWLNSQASIPLDLTYSSGTIINGVDLQTPRQDINYIIKTPPNDVVYLSNMIQYNQNANNFIDDVRGEGETIIPIADDNRKIILFAPSKKYGDGTEEDLSNIQSNTKTDQKGCLPVSTNKSIFFKENIISNISGYFKWKDIQKFYIKADNYYSVHVSINITLTSTENEGYCYFRLYNNTTNSYTPTSQNQQIYYSSLGITSTINFYMNVKPGINEIILKGENATQNDDTITPQINCII